jgi:hypothetical protein
MEDLTIDLACPFRFKGGIVVAETDFIRLTNKGFLTIRKGYSWDGPSGPTFDTKNFMRGSLVHDVLYQLMRIQILSLQYRDFADKKLREIVIADGMNAFRAAYVYRAVRIFGGVLLKKDLGNPQDIIHNAP